MAEKMRYNKIIDLLEHGKPVFSTSTVPNGRDAMKSGPISGVMTNCPFGLRWLDASLARNLL